MLDINSNLLKRYLSRVVAGRGMFGGLKYELLISIFKDFPGGMGIFLRSIFYKLIFMSMGRRVFIEHGVTVRCPNKIIADDSVFIEHSSSLIAASKRNVSIHLKEGVNIGIDSILYTYAQDGHIVVGENSRVSHKVQILAHSRIEIGKNVLIGGFSYISSSAHIFTDTKKPIIEQGYSAKGIKIGDDVWIGAHVNILDGVEIGRGSVIGAGAVVNQDIPEYSIAVGVPAQVVGKRGG